MFMALPQQRHRQRIGGKQQRARARRIV